MIDALDYLVRQLRETPIGDIYDEEREKTKNEIANLLMGDKKYHELVVCTNSILTGESILTDVPKISEYPTTVKFSEDLTFFENGFEVYPRYCCEYDIFKKQLIVGCFITDGLNIIGLRNKAGVLNGLTTLVHGHVAFDATMYITPESDFLYKNIIKEVKEEIGIEVTNTLPEEPRYIINNNSDFTSLEHLGIIYKLKVKDCYALMGKLVNFEQEKHDIVVFDKYVNNEQLDSWMQLIIQHELDLIR